MQCKICRQDNLPEARFCANCGAILVTAVEPPSLVAVPETVLEYVGFPIRLAASIIDGVIITVVSFIIFRLLLGTIMPGLLLFWLYYWLFTGLKGQTPGKMVFGIKVVNVQGDIPGLGIAAMREILGKTVSAIILGLGFLWIIWDKQNRGWHDIIANTRVVKVIKAESEE